MMKICLFTSVVAVTITWSAMGLAQEKPMLAVSCAADKSVVAAGDSVTLTVRLENHGSSDIYIYRTLEWGWSGIGYILTNDRGNVVHSQKHVIPPPHTPVYDKSQLVGLAPGYFFGSYLIFDLSH